MSDVAVRVENLSKCYRLGTVAKATLYESFERLVRPSKYAHEQREEKDFWALKDVSFEIKQGDVVGIIGRNGAGKSTLLKILSRITKPTSGRAVLNGRVASLLEVGTGFHPELTGRENIYLNGSILGMKRSEIKSKFDEIVAFSGVEKFLDTPVKRYSSGMYVRLAFSVAAHLEPEILIIDEVLAVGDAEFQKKCLGKMQEVAGEGRTVLFVSHNMGAVESLCNKGIFLNSGTVFTQGIISSVIAKYQSNNTVLSQIELSKRKDRKGSQTFLFTQIYLTDLNSLKIDSVKTGQSFYINLKIHNYSNITYQKVRLDVGIMDSTDAPISLLSTSFHNDYVKIHPGENNIKINIYKFPLDFGFYQVILFSKNDTEISDWISNAFLLEVIQGDFFDNGRILPNKYGNIIINHNFEIN